MPTEDVMKLTKSERVELQRQASARNRRADSARRARLILLLAQGFTWAEITAGVLLGVASFDILPEIFAIARAISTRAQAWSLLWPGFCCFTASKNFC